MAALPPEVRDHDPRLALDGGADGLDFYRRLAVEAGAFLQPAGRMMLEFGDGQAGALQALFANAGWQVESVENDYSGQARILVLGR
jgi:release factor glutamine methyltransferase